MKKNESALIPVGRIRSVIILLVASAQEKTGKLLKWEAACRI